MTERTVIKQSLRTDDADSISVNSTQESEVNEEREYVVDRILAEQDDSEGNKYYLIRWEGYGLVASTWEPAENIDGQATLDDWADERMRVTRGLSREFDIAAFEEEQERVRLDKEERRQRRKAKRERLGLATSFSDSEEDASLAELHNKGKQHVLEAGSGEIPVEKQIERSRLRPGSQSKTTTSNLASESEDDFPKSAFTAKVKRRTINLPTQNHRSDTSEDSLVEELKQSVRRGTAKDKRSRTTVRRRARDSLDFVSDDDGESMLSQSASPRGIQLPEAPKKRDAKAHSPTHYMGTAKRSTGAPLANPPGHDLQVRRGATRGRPRGRPRGSGRGRGQERAPTDTISFTAPNNGRKPTTKRSLANTILNAPTSNSTKLMEHFKTPSMVRKAELAARFLADRVPDMQSIGLLSRPSDYGRPVRKAPQQSHLGSEVGQNNQGSFGQTLAASIELGSKPKPSPENEEGMVSPAEPEFQTRTGVMERTSGMELDEMNTSNQIAADIDRLSRDLPHETPPRPRAIIQEQAKSPATHLIAPGFSNAKDSRQPLQPDDFDQSSLYKLQTTVITPETNANPSPRPVTKINLKEYKSRKKTEFMGDAVPAQAIFGDSKVVPILIGFTDVDKIIRTHWASILSGHGVLNFDRICVAQEFQTQLGFLRGTVHATGDVITGTEESPIIDEITEWLRPCSGLVFIHDVFCILVFPARCEEWKFLDPNSDIDHKLCYHIYVPKSLNSMARQFSNPIAETAMSSLDLKRRNIVTLVELTQNLQYQTLLPPNLEGQNTHNFYLFFPRKASTSAKYLVDWLRACNSGCRIYTNRKFGSWDMFSNNPVLKAGVIIIHQFLLPSIFKIPRIARLINGNNPFIFWCTDDGSSSNPFRLDFSGHDARPSCKPSMIRLFPHGGAVFLTPSFLITQPERTSDVLKWFQKKLASSTPGTWRLVLPNKCCQYLLDLAVEMASARDKLYANDMPGQSQHDVDAVAASQCLSHEECKARFKSYSMLDQLLKRGHMVEAQDHWEEYSLDDLESPVVYVDESIDQSDEKALVTWFAGWTMLHLNLYRKFMVVGTSSINRKATGTTAKVAITENGQGKTAGTTVPHQPIRQQIIGDLAATEKKWNRNAFTEVDDSYTSTPAPTLKANETANTQNHRSMKDLVDVPLDVDSDYSVPSTTSGPHRKESNISKVMQRSSHQGSRARHGIDENQPPAILEFIAITGTETETAKKYLSKYNGDVHLAVQRFWYAERQPSSPQPRQQTDGANDSGDPAAVVNFIPSTHTTAIVAEKYLHLAQDDVRRAIALYNESHQYPRSPSSGIPNQGIVGDGGLPKGLEAFDAPQGPANRRHRAEDSHEEFSRISQNSQSRKLPDNRLKGLACRKELELESGVTSGQIQVMEQTHDLHGGQSEAVREMEDDGKTSMHPVLSIQTASLKQTTSDGDILSSYDGVDDRQDENDPRPPKTSGIVTDKAGKRQFVPRSVRPSGTIRPEIGVRPGYIPLEDKPVYRNRRSLGGIPQYELQEIGNSGGVSRNCTLQSPTEIDTNINRSSLPGSATSLSTENKKLYLESNFETTMEWYEKLRKSGQGWEHIYVGGWEACFPRLMNVKR